MTKYVKLFFPVILFLLQSFHIFAQITITGTVTDGDNGETLPGVSVTVGKAGTFTNINGYYTLTLPDVSASDIEVNFNCIGYVPKK